MNTTESNDPTSTGPYNPGEKPSLFSGGNKIDSDTAAPGRTSRLAKDTRPIPIIIMEKAAHGAYPINFAVKPSSSPTSAWLSVKWYEEPRLAAIEFSDDSVVYVARDSIDSGADVATRHTAIGNVNVNMNLDNFDSDMDAEVNNILNRHPIYLPVDYKYIEAYGIAKGQSASEILVEQTRASMIGAALDSLYRYPHPKMADAEIWMQYPYWVRTADASNVVRLNKELAKMGLDYYDGEIGGISSDKSMGSQEPSS